MLNLKIWGVAQTINAIISLILFREVGLLEMPFALIGGLPAILFYALWLTYLSKSNMTSLLKAITTYIVLTISTSICAIGVAILIEGFDTEITPFIIVPALATIISVTIFLRDITHLSTQGNDKI